MKRSTLASAIYTALAFTAFSTTAFAQDTAATSDDETTEIDEVVVTGSLIPQAMKDTASPVTTITAEEIQRQGYQDVADVLRAQPLSTGSVQDNQFVNGFTPGAETISLLGLSPSFTLVLIDGRPLADYPLLYNGQSNFTDLSSIPTAMVERIDILPGNQSAIYGSAAIAGVVNVILKKHIDGMNAGIRVGGYTQGGGENWRVQFSGGQDWDRFSLTWGLQHSDQDPVYGFDRDFRDSSEDNPNPNNRFGSRTWLVFNPFTNQYRDPRIDGDGDPNTSFCDGVTAGWEGTTGLDFRPGRGFYCGTRSEPGYSSLLNRAKDTAVYLNGNYDLNDNATLYGSVLFGRGKVSSDSGARFWTPDINGLGFVVQPSGLQPIDPVTGECIDTDPDVIGNCDSVFFRSYQHIFAPEEVGPNGSREQNTSDSYNLALGIKGNLGASDWTYDGYYSRSQYKVKNRQMWPLTADVETFMHEHFMGDVIGTYYGYPVYNPSLAGFYTMITPEEYASFLGEIHTDSKAWTHSGTFQVANTNLWEMPAGAVGMAALVTVGRQEWENPTDPRVIAGEFWGLTGTSGSGERTNWAVATEFRIPIAEKFTANVSGRFDSYKNYPSDTSECIDDTSGALGPCEDSSDSKATWKAGFEVRPTDELLLRANYATAFRAPDMGYSFAGDSGFFTSAPDYYGCFLDGDAPEDCLPSQVEGRRRGNPDLKSITADSYGVGLVWSPSKIFDIRADYYNVDIQDEVSDISINGLLFDEYRCRIGVAAGGLDPASPTCIDAFTRVERGTPFDPNAIDIVRINPINVSKERVSGIQIGTTIRWDLDTWGNLTFGADYNNTMSHEYQQYAGDDPIDLLQNGESSTEFHSILTGDVTWEWNAFTAAVHGVRYGSTPNNSMQLGVVINGVPEGKVGPYMLYNVHLAYDFTPNQTLSLTVNNVFDKDPPRDKSYGGVADYPFYNIFNYSGLGRSWWLEYEISFGQKE
jgi:outer membrane receptor protein involved in Fe transport